MKRISLRPIAKRRHLASGIALALSICAGSGPIPRASAQTIGSVYTSTAPKDCRVRKAADEFARGFKCGKDEVKVIGNSGRAVEMAARR